MIAAVLAGVAVVLIGAHARPRPLRCTMPLVGAHVHPPPSRASSRPWRRRPRRRRRIRPRCDDASDLAAWCDRLAQAVRGGSTLAAAVRTTDPPATDDGTIARLTAALDRGLPLRQALGGATGPTRANLDIAVTVLAACSTSGGPAAEPLDRAAAVLRGRAAATADRRIQSAQARMSAVVMTVLPVAMLAILIVTSRPVRVAVRGPIGVVVIAAGLTLNALGWRWMRRLIDGAAR